MRGGMAIGVVVVVAVAVGAGGATAGPRGTYRLAPDDGVSRASISNILFLNRCAAGCTFTQGNVSDSRQNITFLGGRNDGFVYTITPFAHPDPVWTDLVACVREMYRPYDVVVTDVDPGLAIAHHEAVVAGTNDDLRLPSTVGGVGPLYPNCSLHDDTVSFSFANKYPPDVLTLCSLVAQETAHGFGLEHSLDCSNPMTYLGACGRQFFRNSLTDCGEYAPRPCDCSLTKQNTHDKLVAVFGLNPIPMPAPTMTLDAPAAGAVIPAGATFPIVATGAPADARGLGTIELWFNGYKWDEGHASRDQTELAMTSPANLPDGVIDLEVRVFNDLGTSYATQTVRVTKGAPCTSADTCRDGQQCADGRCYWDPPVGVLGDTCDYDQYCLSAICVAGACSEECEVAKNPACQYPYECVSDGSPLGYCLAPEPPDSGGCCSVGDDGPGAGALLVQLGLAGLVLGGVQRPSTARGASRRARSG